MENGKKNNLKSEKNWSLAVVQDDLISHCKEVLVKIKIIVPITLESFRENAEIEYKTFLKKGSMFSDLEFDVGILERGEGPVTIESEYDGAFADRGSVLLTEKAEKDGYDGVVIDCFCDAGYHPAREAVDIPVVGAFETSIRFAQLLGNNISIVTMKDTFIPRIWRMARGMNAADSIVSVSSLDIEVASLTEFKSIVVERLVAQFEAAILKNGADVLILGCTGMMGVAEKVQNILIVKGYNVPVVNPAETCLRFMECILVMGLKQSEIAYPTNKRKKR